MSPLICRSRNITRLDIPKCNRVSWNARGFEDRLSPARLPHHTDSQARTCVRNSSPMVRFHPSLPDFLSGSCRIRSYVFTTNPPFSVPPANHHPSSHSTQYKRRAIIKSSFSLRPSSSQLTPRLIRHVLCFPKSKSSKCKLKKRPCVVRVAVHEWMWREFEILACATGTLVRDKDSETGRLSTRAEQREMKKV